MCSSSTLLHTKDDDDSSEAGDDSSEDKITRIDENNRPLWSMNGPNQPHFAQGPSATNLNQPMIYAQHVMPGVLQRSPTIDRAYSGWGEATTVYTQPVTREVEMDDLIIKSSSPLEDEEIIISDEGVPLIDQWPRRINMKDENIQVSRAMDSAEDPMEDVKPM